MDQNSHSKEEVEGNKRPRSRYIQIKLFPFIMLLFSFVFITALVTAGVMMLGDDKQVKVSIPERKEFNKLYSVYDEIQKKYYEKTDTPKMIEGAIKGLISSLGDSYSSFMTKKESGDFDNVISSSFEGIGAELQSQDGNITVISPIKHSPAEKAGLKAKDIILSVNGKSLKGSTISEATDKIRGKKGTEVQLTVQREGVEKPFTIKITRGEIPIDTVYSEMGGDKIAHVTISSFSEKTTEELVKALKKLEQEDMKGLVIDLRGNPGGLLDQAFNIANMFVEDGKVILQEEDKSGQKTSITADHSANNGYKVKVPTTMLIDSGSASASEILAAAAKESGQVKLVGTKSFGKGTIQTASKLDDGSTVKLTIAKWLTPNGEWIHKKGITPDKTVEMPKYASFTIPSASKKYQEGDYGDDVKVIKSLLKALDYNVGEVNGIYNHATAYAVERFQNDNQLDITGVMTGKTTDKLVELIRKQLKEEDPQLKAAKDMVK